MGEIKVMLQYPWKFPDSSYYKNILDFPPEEINYINYQKKGSKKMEIIGSSRKFEKMRKFKNMIRKILRVIRLPNLTFSLKKNYDLIHCAHCLTLNRKPWIVDTEVYDRLASAGGNVAIKGLGKWIIKKRLESENCKKIIAWSKDCKKTFEDAFPRNRKILNKLTIVPFALPPPKYKIKKHKGIRILFVARWFDAKGGRYALEVFDRLSKKYPNLEFIFICPTPNNFKKKYGGNKSIKIMELMPQERIFSEYYTSSDIFFYPGYGDSYGFAVPEALAFGLPVISTKTFAKSELVKNGKTGFLVDMPDNWKGYEGTNESLVERLYEKTAILIENKKLRESMASDAKKEATHGLFSIKQRNEMLKKIYEEALN